MALLQSHMGDKPKETKRKDVCAHSYDSLTDFQSWTFQGQMSLFHIIMVIFKFLVKLAI